MADCHFRSEVTLIVQKYQIFSSTSMIVMNVYRNYLHTVYKYAERSEDGTQSLLPLSEVGKLTIIITGSSLTHYPRSGLTAILGQRS